MHLGNAFFERDAKTVARELLGKFLVRRIGRKMLSYMITETEAYVGPHDKASHSYGGRRTKRNEVMYGPPGHWYVYFTYGMHYMLNLVTGKDGYPSAVLIRAIESPISHSNILKNVGMRKKRQLKLNGPVPLEKSRPKMTKALFSAGRSLTGPGKLTKALGIDKRMNGKPVRRSSGLWIEDRPLDTARGKGIKIPRRAVRRTPRIGIPYAEEWVEKPLRYILNESWLKKSLTRTTSARSRRRRS